MPPVLGLSDAEVADVITFVRNAWSNDAAGVKEADVAAVRAATKDRQMPWTAADLK
jgi:mono/diheme cytochrome c family protein